MTDSLRKRYLTKLIANIVNGLINIILVSIVPKALGPISYGYFSFLQQFFVQVIAFLDAGSSISFFTKLSANNDRKELIKFYLIFSFLLLGILTVIIGLSDIYGYTDLFLIAIPDDYIYTGMLFGYFTWLTQIYTKISDAYAMTVKVELIKIFHKTLMLVTLFYLVNNTYFDLNIYYYFQLSSLLFFLFIISLFFLKKQIFTDIKINIDFKKIAFEFYIFCAPLFVFSLVAVCIGLFDIWLLQKISGPIETGYYGLAYSIAAISFLFTSAMTPVITREFAKSFEEKNMLGIKVLFNRYVPMLYAISAYFSVFVAFQADDLLSIFTDERFKDAYFVLVVIAFYPLHQTYGQINAAVFFATEDTTRYRNIGFISAVIGLFFSYFFVFFLQWGAEGFAWKMILSQIIGVNIQLFLNVKKLHLNHFKFIFHQVYTVIIFSVLAFLSNVMVTFNTDIKLDFMITGMIYTLFTFLIIWIMPFVIGSSRKELTTICLKIKNL
jgi:O-antigen/teichoic acid export membrane protein